LYKDTFIFELGNKVITDDNKKVSIVIYKIRKMLFFKDLMKIGKDKVKRLVENKPKCPIKIIDTPH
jgi:hypothetical protein